MPRYLRPAGTTEAFSIRIFVYLCHGTDWPFLDGDEPELLDTQRCQATWDTFNLALLALAEQHPGFQRPRSPDAWARAIAAGPPTHPVLPVDVIEAWYHAQDWR